MNIERQKALRPVRRLSNNDCVFIYKNINGNIVKVNRTQSELVYRRTKSFLGGMSNFRLNGIRREVLADVLSVRNKLQEKIPANQKSISRKQEFEGIAKYMQGVRPLTTVHGLFLKVGNAKLGDDTLVFSTSSCWFCANRLSCELSLAGVCYDISACKRHPNHNLACLTNLVEFLTIKRLVLTNEEKGLKYLEFIFRDIFKKFLNGFYGKIDNSNGLFFRINESGDIRDNTELKMWNTVAKLGFEEFGIKSYGYTHTKGLNIVETVNPEYYFISASNPDIEAHHRFKVVKDNEYRLKDGETFCECFVNSIGEAKSSTCKGCLQCKELGTFHTSVELIH